MNGKPECESSPESDPVCITLVSSGSRGESLLFRYPYEVEEPKDTSVKGFSGNPFAVRISEDQSSNSLALAHCSSIKNGTLVGFSDKILANLLAVNADLCARNFELKINDVIFVGYPMLLQTEKNTKPSGKREAQCMISFNVVFVLKANADEEMVSCYQDLARQLSVALKHEERRCSYLNNQKIIMQTIQDEVATRPEDSFEPPYRLMLRKSSLAKQLKSVYDSLCTNGIVQLHINKWIQINFCLPHKVHSMTNKNHLAIKPQAVKKCLEALRPFHATLLLVDEEALLESLPLDCSPSLIRLIKVSSPLKSLQDLAIDADLSLRQVFNIVSQLVYWGKATVIYPLCESNVYCLAPNADTFVNSILVEKFVEQFPGVSLPAVMSDFSLPTALGEHRDVLGLPQQQAQQVQMVVWLLKHRLLVQLHTYVFLLPGDKPQGSSSSRISQASLLSPNGEDTLKPACLSDTGSVYSDGSPAKSPSVDMTNGSTIISTEESLVQWRLHDHNFSSLTPSQKQCVLTIPSINNPEDSKLFVRLCPYFNGKYHLEEIMYYENIRRSQLVTLLDKFRDVLLTCRHEDPGTASWVNG